MVLEIDQVAHCHLPLHDVVVLVVVIVVHRVVDHEVHPGVSVHVHEYFPGFEQG